MVMAVASRLAPISPDPWPSEAFSENEIAERLQYWREHWLEWKAGNSNPVLTGQEIRNSLDRWLDERLELRGR